MVVSPEAIAIAKSMSDLRREATAAAREAFGLITPKSPTKRLDPKMAKVFKQNLEQGVSPEAFFSANKDVLGERSDYDLAEFGVKNVQISASRPTGTKKLDDRMAKVLRSHIDGGGSAEEFFEANQDILGSQNQYDLTGFSK